MTKKIFILGIGAQKAGTSWLHAQLQKQPSVNLGAVKEYHFLDSLFGEHKNNMVELLKRDTLKNNRKGLFSKWLNKPTRYDFVCSPELYFDYFQKLARKRNTQYVGDITPAYSTLPIEAFKYCKQELERKGFHVKIVFLMRDPVERIWSQVRMTKKQQINRGVPSQKSDDSLVIEGYKKPYVELRTRYEKTVDIIESVFPSQDIYYGFYESLFTEKSLSRLADFLNISFDNIDIDERVNVSDKKEMLSLDVINEVRTYYHSTYEFIDDMKLRLD